MNETPETSREQPFRIPGFQSVQEETEFWDTHDITGYLDEPRPVHIRFAPNLSCGVTSVNED